MRPSSREACFLHISFVIRSDDTLPEPFSWVLDPSQTLVEFGGSPLTRSELGMQSVVGVQGRPASANEWSVRESAEVLVSLLHG